MLINVRVVPGSSRIRVCEEPGRLKVYLTRPAQDGEANEQLLKVLSAHFKTKKYLLTIRKGISSRDKVVEITTA